MSRLTTGLFLATCLAGSVGPVQANVPRSEPDIQQAAVQPRLVYPSVEMVLRALPNGPPRQIVRIRYEVQQHQVGPCRVYPLVGAGRLVEARFKCVVVSERGRQVVVIDTSRLEPAK